MTPDRIIPEIQPQPYSFGAAFAQGWELLTARYGMILAGTAIYLGVAVLVQVAQNVISAATDPVVGFLLSVPMSLLVLAPFQASWMWSAVAAARGEPAGAATLVHGFDRYPQVVGLALLAFGASIVLWIPLGILAVIFAMMGPVGIVLLILLAIPAGVLMGWLYIRYMLAYCIVLDDRPGRMGVFEAVRAAFDMTRGIRGWSLLGLNLVVSLIAGLSLLLLILPFFLFGIPFVVAVTAMAYQQLAADHGLVASVNCRFCGFDLSGLRDRVCPECGAPTAGGSDARG